MSWIGVKPDDFIFRVVIPDHFISFLSGTRMVKLWDVIENGELLKPNPRRVLSAFCIIEAQITLATLIVVLTAVSHGLLVIDAGKLHFYGIKCTLWPTLLPSNDRSLPTMMLLYSPGQPSVKCRGRERHSSRLLMARVTSQLKMFPQSPLVLATGELPPVLWAAHLSSFVNIIFDQIFPF